MAGCSPIMQDQYQNYEDWQTLGSARNVFASFGENSTQVSRNGFSGVTIVSNGNGTAVVDVVCTEPCVLSPFFWGSGCRAGLTNLQTLDITLNMNSNWSSRVWRLDDVNGNPISNVAISFNAAPQLLFTYLSRPYLFDAPLNKPFSYPFDDV